jgi:hypothetical protein
MKSFNYECDDCEIGQMEYDYEEEDGDHYICSYCGNEEVR